MSSRKAKHDIAPAMRGNFLRALEEIQRRKNKPISEIMADWIEDDPIAMINAISKFAVREKSVTGKIDHDHKHTHEHIAVQEIDSWVREITSQEEDRLLPPPLPN